MRMIMLSILAAASVGSALGQSRFPVTPAHPTRFETRAIGSGVGTSAIVSEPKRAEVQKIVFIAVSPHREWTSKEGKTITGSLLAFEQGDVDKVPRPFALIKDGKIRMLKSGSAKPFVFSMNVLSEEDQTYIQALEASNKEAAARAEASEDQDEEQ